MLQPLQAEGHPAEEAPFPCLPPGRYERLNRWGSCPFADPAHLHPHRRRSRRRPGDPTA